MWHFKSSKKMNKIVGFGYLERTSCIGCGSGFQPQSFNFAAGSRSHREFFYGNLNFPDKRLMGFGYQR
jgi:hypothetical protein